MFYTIFIGIYTSTLQLELDQFSRTASPLAPQRHTQPHRFSNYSRSSHLQNLPSDSNQPNPLQFQSTKPSSQTSIQNVRLLLHQAIRHEAGPRGSEPRQRSSPHRSTQHPPPILGNKKKTNNIYFNYTETPRELLRKVRPQARQLALQQRTDLHDVLHGEVHGRLEPGQRGVHQQDTTGAGKQLKTSTIIKRMRNDWKKRRGRKSIKSEVG